MRDSRKTRAMLVIGLGAAVGAILSDWFIKPTLERMVNTR